MGKDVIACVEDLFFRSKIEATARHLNAPIRFVGAKELPAACAKGDPAAVLLELSSADSLASVRALRQGKATAGVLVIGFLSHVDQELARRRRGGGRLEDHAAQSVLGDASRPAHGSSRAGHQARGPGGAGAAGRIDRPVRSPVRALSSWFVRILTQRRRRYQHFVVNDPDRLKATIQPGDVLLVDGNQRVSQAIKYLTMSSWSHSALYVGDALLKRDAAMRAAVQHRFGREARYLARRGARGPGRRGLAAGQVHRLEHPDLPADRSHARGPRDRHRLRHFPDRPPSTTAAISGT